MLNFLLIFNIVVSLIVIVILCRLLVNSRQNLTSNFIDEKFKDLFSQMAQKELSNFDVLSKQIQNEIKSLGDIVVSNQKLTDEYQSRKFSEIDKNILDKQEFLNKSVIDLVSQLELRFKTFESSIEQRLNAIRTFMEERLISIQESNEKKLEEMRHTVDEKLQKTLESRMTASFNLVNERLEQVYKGLGEMKNLATGVTDLKKVLSNVKTRGILGEIQLKAILEEILSPEQYEENIATVPKSTERVEFAVKLPGDEHKCVYLPIDSKFPLDAYADLQKAYENESKLEIDEKFSILAARIKKFAKDIHEKYISPPHTTEFAIMFLPFEGLYSEVVNRGLVEILQREYQVNIAGPSTMAALLNSVQMGFKTLAIQKRSSEVWNILGAVKTEFDKFATILQDTQTKLEQANDRLDKLVGVRTRAIQRKLRDVEKIDISSAENILEE